MQKLRFSALLLGLCLIAGLAFAQSALLDVPRQSQHAIVMQRIGVTDITINYHRPEVNKRTIFGGVIPYGEVWRAGANENTTIKFTDPVTIEGKPLDKGTYGLHMIPGKDEWTVIFSKMSTAWGSFSYDAKEDALRVSVKPQASDFREALSYDFDQVKPDSTVATMRWEKVAVPFTIGVNLQDTVSAAFNKQLRGMSQYYWQGWDDAANYWLTAKNYDEALKDVNKSVEIEERYDNLMTKSKVLSAMGKTDESKVALNQALEKASPLQIHFYARGLQGEKKQDEAFAIFRTNAQKHPELWFTHTGLARIYCAEGNYDKAAAEMKTALEKAPDNQKTYVGGLVKKLEAKQNIN